MVEEVMAAGIGGCWPSRILSQGSQSDEDFPLFSIQVEIPVQGMALLTFKVGIPISFNPHIYVQRFVSIVILNLSNLLSVLTSIHTSIGIFVHNWHFPECIALLSISSFQSRHLLRFVYLSHDDENCKMRASCNISYFLHWGSI